MCREGYLGNVGEPPVSRRHARKRGPGDHRPWRRPGAATRRRAHTGHHEQRKYARYRGTRDTRRTPRGPGGQSSRRRVPGKVGKCGPSDPREGRRRRAAHPPAGQRGETLRALTLTTAGRWTVQGQQQLCVRNRRRAWRTSGSVGGPGGKPSALPGR